MGYKFIVKTWRWVNGQVTLVQTTFDDELSALQHARMVNPAETVKVYVNEEVILSAYIPADSYA